MVEVESELPSDTEDTEVTVTATPVVPQTRMTSTVTQIPAVITATPVEVSTATSAAKLAERRIIKEKEEEEGEEEEEKEEEEIEEGEEKEEEEEEHKKIKKKTKLKKASDILLEEIKAIREYEGKEEAREKDLGSYLIQKKLINCTLQLHDKKINTDDDQSPFYYLNEATDILRNHWEESMGKLRESVEYFSKKKKVGEKEMFAIKFSGVSARQIDVQTLSLLLPNRSQYDINHHKFIMLLPYKNIRLVVWGITGSLEFKYLEDESDIEYVKNFAKKMMNLIRKIDPEEEKEKKLEWTIPYINEYIVPEINFLNIERTSREYINLLFLQRLIYEYSNILKINKEKESLFLCSIVHKKPGEIEIFPSAENKKNKISEWRKSYLPIAFVNKNTGYGRIQFLSPFKVYEGNETLVPVGKVRPIYDSSQEETIFGRDEDTKVENYEIFYEFISKKAKQDLDYFRKKVKKLYANIYSIIYLATNQFLPTISMHLEEEEHEIEPETESEHEIESESERESEREHEIETLEEKVPKSAFLSRPE